MADAKISALAQATSVGDTDEFVVNDSGTTKKVQAQDIISTGIVGAGLIGGGGSSLAVNVDSTTTEISGGAVIVKDDGIKLAKMFDGAMGHTIYYNASQQNNGATTGSDVNLDYASIDTAYMTIGARITARAFFTCDAGTGTGSIKVLNPDLSSAYTAVTPTITAGADDKGYIELEIYAAEIDKVFVLEKVYLLNNQNYVETTANSGFYINGFNKVTLDSNVDGDYGAIIGFYVNGSDANDMNMDYAMTTLQPFKDST